MVSPAFHSPHGHPGLLMNLRVSCTLNSSSPSLSKLKRTEPCLAKMRGLGAQALSWEVNGDHWEFAAVSPISVLQLLWSQGRSGNGVLYLYIPHICIPIFQEKIRLSSCFPSLSLYKCLENLTWNCQIWVQRLAWFISWSRAEACDCPWSASRGWREVLRVGTGSMCSSWGPQNLVFKVWGCLLEERYPAKSHHCLLS